MKIRDEREQEAETFWKEKQDFVHAPAVNLTEKLKSEKLREKLALRREKRRLEEKLAESKGLADSDSDDDASAWVRKQKEAVQQKLLAEKKAKELDELDSEFGVGELVDTEFVKQKNKAYTDRDLKGLKVLHGQDRIEEGNTVILTLKDKDVLNEDDDVLVNPNMIDDEKFEKNLENRKLRPEYNGYNVFDEIEYDSDGNLKGKGVLGKYDEEIGGQQSKGSFVIGEDTSEEARRAKIREKMLRSDKILESAESTSLRIASDFFTPDEMVKFKKPGKKKVR
ncbi:U4/U6.U5 tri-snRNP-associated protein 1 [Orchesella cincta]|uniref:U4/U6.U5 tri-snRNP-associated protein 1 n=1 Tax=Orchesella cincta TaxID=48709 RepID=A0A1D2M9D3_ORCCI|nr:U4/U6.U5 tri-snRNP-associated protein 1 [Orchesella cincta]